MKCKVCWFKAKRWLWMPFWHHWLIILIPMRRRLSLFWIATEMSYLQVFLRVSFSSGSRGSGREPNLMVTRGMPHRRGAVGHSAGGGRIDGGVRLTAYRPLFLIIFVTRSHLLVGSQLKVRVRNAHFASFATSCRLHGDVSWTNGLRAAAKAAVVAVFTVTVVVGEAPASTTAVMPCRSSLFQAATHATPSATNCKRGVGKNRFCRCSWTGTWTKNGRGKFYQNWQKALWTVHLKFMSKRDP